ncbi:tetratricopeptide repeat protein [Microcystis aeruginosa EAWAG127a]|uniref:Tetratricopeptide repeat protein n=1 Tax=Microcystis aeruginosa EAWAG127a TaxID=2529855 RepID=A0A5J5LUE7_MICAE|nr:DnaJ domain-containing protein [Microcystis aeruginosa]KAB0241005.1 tetratricopeptide repeat protein [Microcystis aeruginosa EAWAG127a]
MKNYYEILQIPRNASNNQIKTAFRRLARQYHPDYNPNDPEAVAKFREIEQAYRVLSDKEKRKEYDRSLSPEIPTFDRSAQDFYQQGWHYAQEKNYQLAIAFYQQAIAINPRFWQAYLQRAEVYYHNQQDRQVLSDCRQVLQLKPDCSQAYYYLGLSRQRLGYTQSSLEAYGKAIAIDQNNPQFYYQRGLALEELSELPAARKDFQIAAKKFKQQGNFRRYHAIINKLKYVHKSYRQQQSITWSKTLFIIFNLLKISFLSLLKPKTGLAESFFKLDRNQALATGILAAIVSSFFIAFTWQNWTVKSEFLLLLGWAAFPFITLTLSSWLGRKLSNKYGSFTGDIFLAGLIILPFSLVILLTSYLSINGDIIGAIIGVTGGYLTGILYYSYRHLSNISSQISLLLLPFVLGFLTVNIWGVYYYL